MTERLTKVFFGLVLFALVGLLIRQGWSGNWPQVIILVSATCFLALCYALAIMLQQAKSTSDQALSHAVHAVNDARKAVAEAVEAKFELRRAVERLNRIGDQLDVLIPTAIASSGRHAAAETQTWQTSPTRNGPAPTVTALPSSTPPVPTPSPRSKRSSGGTQKATRQRRTR